MVILQVMQSVIQEAKQEATELMVLLDDDAPMMVSPFLMLRWPSSMSC